MSVTFKEDGKVEIFNSETGELKTFTEKAYIKERDRLLVLWQIKQKGLANAKEEELTARKEAVLFMHDADKAGKQETVALGNGYAAKVKVPVSYGFVKTEDEKIDKVRIDKALSKIEKDGEVGALIADRLVKWSPSLSVSEYKLLTDKHKKIIDEVLITSEGTPTLSIKEPKTK